MEYLRLLNYKGMMTAFAGGATVSEARNGSARPKSHGAANATTVVVYVFYVSANQQLVPAVSEAMVSFQVGGWPGYSMATGSSPAVDDPLEP